MEALLTTITQFLNLNNNRFYPLAIPKLFVQHLCRLRAKQRRGKLKSGDRYVIA